MLHTTDPIIKHKAGLKNHLPMLRILTDQWRCVLRTDGSARLLVYLAINDIDHTKTKAQSPQTNGICECFHNHSARVLSGDISQKALRDAGKITKRLGRMNKMIQQ